MYLWYVDSLVHTFVIFLIILLITGMRNFRVGWVFSTTAIQFSCRKSMKISTLVGFETLIFSHSKTPAEIITAGPSWKFGKLSTPNHLGFRFDSWIFSGFFHSQPWRFVPKAQHLCVSEVRADHTYWDLNRYWFSRGTQQCSRDPGCCLLDIGVVRNPSQLYWDYFI